MKFNFQTVQSTLVWIAIRLKEPSTVISLGFALAYFHVPITQTALQMGVDGIRDILVGATILMGIVMPEKAVVTTLPVPSIDRATVTAN